MSVLAWICLASFLGGALSVCLAALVGMGAAPHRVPMLISYAVGALLGAAFLDVLPQAVSALGGVESAAPVLLVGILLFFLLEKLVLWRHCHEEQCEGHDPGTEQASARGHGHSHGHGHNHGQGAEPGARSGTLILVGDTFHNFVDGVLIAAAFMQSVPLGIVTALAIVAHEIPQELGDYLILLHSGFSRLRALMFNLLSSVATLVGGVGAYYALASMSGAVPYLLCLAATSMIYVAVADLIPGLHRRAELSATVQQMSLIGLGILTIVSVHFLVDQISF